MSKSKSPPPAGGDIQKQTLTGRRAEITALQKEVREPEAQLEARPAAGRKQPEIEGERMLNITEASPDFIGMAGPDTQAGQETAAATALDEIFQRALHLAQKRLGYNHLHLFTLEGDNLILQEGSGEAGRKMKEAGFAIPLNAKKSPVARAARTGESLLTPDASQEPGWLPDPLLPRAQSALAVPIKLGDEILGVLNAQNDAAGSLDKEDQFLLEGLCGQIAAAINSRRGKGDHPRSEEALREAAKLQKAILDNAAYAIISTTPEGVFETFNPAAQRMLGYTAQEVVGKATPAILHDVDEIAARAKVFSDELNITIEPGFEVFVAKARYNLPNEHEWTYIRKNGARFPVLLSVTALRDAKGDITGFLGIAQDITERKQAEETLAKQAAELETVIQVSSDAAEILDTAKLLQQVVDLTKERFNLYHAHIYLLDDITNKLNLSAGAGDVGRKMAAQGWSIPLDQEHSLVARAARAKTGIIANDVRQNPDFFPNPLLPNTRSELALPLIVGDTVLGVLDVQADAVEHFTDQDLRIQTTLAAQVAVALQNARLFAEQEKTSLMLQERVKGLNLLNEIGQEAGDSPLIPQFLQWVTERVPTAMQYTDLCIAAIEFDGQVYGKAKAINLPSQIAYGLYIGGQLKGRFYTAYTERREFINEESAMLGAIATRVSGYIENRHLLEQTEAALARTETLYQGSDRIIRASTVEDVLLSLIETTPLRGFDRANIMLFDKDWGEVPPKTLRTAAIWTQSGEPALLPVGTEYTLQHFLPLFLLEKDRPSFVADIARDERIDQNLRALFAQIGMNSFALFPLVVGQQWFGVLTAQSRTPIALTEGQIRQVDSLTDQAASVIQSQRLFEQTQAALDEANLLRRAIEQSLDGSAVADMDGNLLFVNSAWTKMHGYDNEEELLGKPLSIFYTAEQLQNEVEPFNAQVMQKGAHQGEVGHKRKDGTSFPTWMTVAVLLDAEGQPTGLAAAVQDITQRKQMEESIRANEALYHSLLDAIPQNLYRVDREGRIVFGNKAYLELMGMSLAEVTGKIIYDLAPKDLASKYAADDRRVMQSGEVFEEVEIHKERTSGRTIYVQTVKSPVRDLSGQIIGIQGIFWDVTEQRDATMERERLLTEVEDAYRQYVLQEWEQFLEERQQGNLRVEIQPISGGDNGATGATIEAPITLRGQTIGSLKLEDASPERAWSEEDEALVNAISEQLALTVENLRLFEDTHQRATREQLTRQITDKMRAAPDIDSIIESGLSALAGALNVSRAYVKLTPGRPQAGERASG